MLDFFLFCFSALGKHSLKTIKPAISQDVFRQLKKLGVQTGHGVRSHWIEFNCRPICWFDCGDVGFDNKFGLIWSNAISLSLTSGSKFGDELCLPPPKKIEERVFGVCPGCCYDKARTSLTDN